uniref:Uncharacterized protein n=1 Tax=viral metagenome TaxID=1070528 RepID=A0A6C0CB39_9ZZZZ
MKTFVNSDIFAHHIGPVLSLLDLYQLANSCKLFQNIKVDIKTKTVANIENQIKGLVGEKYDMFKNFLIEHHAVVVGSTIIRAVAGDHNCPNDKIDIFMFINEYVNNYGLYWVDFRPTFMKEIDQNSIHKCIIGDTSVSFIMMCDKITIHLLNKRSSYNIEKYINIDRFCYKFDNQITIPNFQTWINKQMDVRFFFGNLDMIVKYHKLGFKFYDRTKMLDDVDLLHMLPNLIKIQHSKHHCAHFVYKGNPRKEFYKIVDDRMSRPKQKIKKCYIPNCVVKVLSPKTRHFHLLDNIYIVE